MEAEEERRRAMARKEIDRLERYLLAWFLELCLQCFKFPSPSLSNSPDKVLLSFTHSLTPSLSIIIIMIVSTTFRSPLDPLLERLARKYVNDEDLTNRLKTLYQARPFLIQSGIDGQYRICACIKLDCVIRGKQFRFCVCVFILVA